MDRHEMLLAEYRDAWEVMPRAKPDGLTFGRTPVAGDGERVTQFTRREVWTRGDGTRIGSSEVLMMAYHAASVALASRYIVMLNGPNDKCEHWACAVAGDAVQAEGQGPCEHAAVLDAVRKVARMERDNGKADR